jgi:hypothetical protein
MGGDRRQNIQPLHSAVIAWIGSFPGSNQFAQSLESEESEENHEEFGELLRRKFREQPKRWADFESPRARSRSPPAASSVWGMKLSFNGMARAGEFDRRIPASQLAPDPRHRIFNGG